MNVLSLFTGAGGGELAFQHLLTGFRTVGYVEIEEYCQKILEQRIADGFLDAAPIFGDIRAFISEGYAEAYQGMVDVLSAGFPCQPFSVAGKRQGADDERNMWPATRDTIRAVRPRYAFLENVPGLLNSGYFSRILGDLHEIGYDARWTVLGARHVGAPHKRDRLWVVAYASESRRQQIPKGAHGYESENEGWPKEKANEPSGGGEGDRTKDVAHARCGNEKECGISEQMFVEWHRKEKSTNQASRSSNNERNEAMAHAILEHDDRCRHESSEVCGKQQKPPGLQRCRNWIVEPSVGRVAHGVAHRVDRLKAIGNGQVPQVAATAWEMLKP